jgi:anti-anti-sigma factor
MLVRTDPVRRPDQMPEPALECDLRWGWLVDTVTVSGEIDTSNADRLGAVLDQLDHNTIIDCRDLRGIDSLGMGELLGMSQRLDESGQHIKLVNVQSDVEQALGVAGLRHLVGRSS